MDSVHYLSYCGQRPLRVVLTFPGGHLTTSEHPELLAATIREIAGRHGVGTPATAPEMT